MAAPVNFHSALVGWLKIVLPLAALMLLSTLFLFARGGTEPTDIPFADIEQAAREQRLGAPRIAGLTDAGDRIEITADTARPATDDPANVEVTRPRLMLDGTAGEWVRVNSGEGRLNETDRTARLSGLAYLETSGGFMMETSALEADLAGGIVTTDGALEIRAPFGELTAGRATITLDAADGGARLLFEDGVRLLFRPDPSAEEAR